MTERKKGCAPRYCHGVSDGSIRGGAGDEGGVLHHAEQHDRDADVEHGADDQRGDDAKGQVALRSLAFFGGGGNRIEADIGEEDDGAAGDDAAEAGRGEGLPVRGMNQHAADDEKSQDGADFDGDHHVVGFGRLAHAAHQQQRQNKDDEKSGQIEVRAGPLPGGPDRGRPFVGQVDAEGGELGLGVSAEAHGDGDVADHVFEDEVPADDPGEDFAERGVGVRVGAARDGDHRGQFGVAESGKAAGDGDQQERNGNRRAGGRTAVHERARRAAGAQEVDQQVQHLGVQDGRRFEVLAGGGGAGEDEDSRANDGADAERGQRPGAERLFEPVSGSSASAISLSMDFRQKVGSGQRRSPACDRDRGFC